MLVPFMSMDFRKYQWEAVVMAPPGVVTVIPQSPSAVGPTAPRKRRSRVDWGRTAWWTNRKTIRTVLPLSFWRQLLLLSRNCIDPNCYCRMLLLVLLHDGCCFYYSGVLFVVMLRQNHTVRGFHHDRCYIRGNAQDEEQVPPRAPTVDKAKADAPMKC